MDFVILAVNTEHRRETYNFFRFLKELWKKTHENYRKKFSLINQFLYVFQCSFYVYVCFVYPLLCLQSIFFANISLVFTITARSWYLVQHQRMDRDFTRKKNIFRNIFFREIDSDDEKETRV